MNPIVAGAVSLCLIGVADQRQATEATLMSLRGAIAVFKIRTDRWPRNLAEVAEARLIDAVPNDAWGRPFLWLRPIDRRGSGCLLSTGPDGQPATADDVTEGCDPAVLNQHLLVRAGLLHASEQRDAYGHPIQLLHEGHGLLAWSYGPDGRPDTSDDQVARIAERGGD